MKRRLLLLFVIPVLVLTACASRVDDSFDQHTQSPELFKHTKNKVSKDDKETMKRLLDLYIEVTRNQRFEGHLDEVILLNDDETMYRVTTHNPELRYYQATEGIPEFIVQFSSATVDYSKLEEFQDLTYQLFNTRISDSFIQQQVLYAPELNGIIRMGSGGLQPLQLEDKPSYSVYQDMYVITQPVKQHAFKPPVSSAETSFEGIIHVVFEKITENGVSHLIYRWVYIEETK